MSATLDYSTKVGAEARGWVRLCRDAVRAEDAVFDAAIALLAAPLRLRLRSHGVRLRHGQVIDSARRYHAMVPRGCRFGDPVVVPDRDAFSATEIRATCTWMSAQEKWQSDHAEPGIAVCKFSLALVDSRLREQWTPISIVSAHAAGRWHERTGKRTMAELLADLAVLTELGDETTDRIPASDGSWLGSVATIKAAHRQTSRARAIRTWVAD